MSSRFEAQLVVTCTNCSVADISETIGRQPDASAEKGTVAPLSGRMRTETEWAINLGWPDGVHPGTEGLGLAIGMFGSDIATALRQLTSRGCTVTLSILQELSDGSDSGVFIPNDAISWLGQANAQLSIDQYVLRHSE